MVPSMRILLATACALVPLIPSTGAAALRPPAEVDAAAAEADVEPVTLTLVAVGDVMMHDLQVRSARGEDGRYRLGDPFAMVRPLVEAADLALANLETPLAGEDMAYSGYPTFNAPRVLARALASGGFDVVQTANNHCMDRREKGLLRTLDALDAEGLLHVGTRADPGADPALWIDHQGLSIAVLAYTFSTNGIPLPPGREGIVSTVDADAMAAEIADVRTRGADLVVLACHWGIEYRHAPEPETVELAHALVEAGADVVLGGHPHFIQPYEIVSTDDGREGFVIYSLGNFWTNMRKRYQDAGMVLRLTLTGVPGGPVALSDVAYLATWVDVTDETGAARHQVIDIAAALPGCGHAARLDAADCAAMEQALEDTVGLLGEGDRLVPEEPPAFTDPTSTGEEGAP